MAVQKIMFKRILIFFIAFFTCKVAHAQDTIVCGQNEHLQNCPYDTCPPETCEAIGKIYHCPLQPSPNCKPSCRCNLNHRRNDKNICVPIQDCPPLTCTGQNEVYDPCPPICPRDTCDDASLNGVCPYRLGILLICNPACTCAEGYYRQNNTSLCIPQKDCFSCTKDNEEFRQSGPAIQPTCASLYADNTGIFANQQRSGCYCKQGFIRDSNNNCIDVKNCYQDLCGKNEVRSCGSACDTTCATLNVTCPIVNIQCNNMCYCQTGFARDDCGLCIPINQCPAKVGCNGDANAVNVSCPNPCPESCESVLSGVKNPVCTRLCVREGCQCKKGYVEDETTNNNCVQIKNCHKCTGPNEQWSRNVDCTCDNIDNCQSKTSDGSEGCRCIDGYVRDANGVCIQAGTCPRCGPSEDYKECGTACPLTCLHPIQNELCIDLCVKGCFCKPGLLRDINGKCVQPDQCSAVGCNGDYDATNVTCPSPCPNTCTNYQETTRICPRFCPHFGCQCNEGFVLDETTNQCVLPENCPGCGGDPNSVHSACGNNCPNTCNALGKTVACPEFCRVGGGCVCKPGYYKGGPLDKCILPEQCPGGCGGDPNAINGSYTIGCDPTCDQQVDSERCSKHDVVVGCACRKGYLYDRQARKCVPPYECTPGCGGDINAYYDPCGNVCHLTCDNMDMPPFCPAICLKVGACRCKAGYVQNKEGQCVRPLQCPRKKCRKNEVYRCPKTCGPSTCDDLKNPIACIPESLHDIFFCTPRCVCKSGFLRNGNGDCIPEAKCV